MKHLLLALLIFATFAPAWTVTAIEAPGADGKRVIIMENAALKLTVDPVRGGRVTSFIWKASGKDWVLPGEAGFFMDHVWQQAWPGELLNRPYEVKILNAGPAKAIVQASVVINGKGDPAIEGVKLIRTMTLTGDNPRLDVTIRLENPTTAPRAPGLWVQNCINVGGERDNLWTWRPTTRGTISGSYDTKLNQPIPNGWKDDFAFDPVAGWSAETHAPSGEGVVFFMDYNNLRCLYDNGAAQSVEWWYEQFRLAPGQAVETNITLFCYAGMPGVSYANPALLGHVQMAIDGTTLTVTNRLRAGMAPPNAPVNVVVQLLDYDTGKEIAEKPFTGVSLGAPIEQTLPVPNAPLMKNLLARVTITLDDGSTQHYETFHAAPGVMGTEKKYQTVKPPRVRPIERPANLGKTPHAGFRLLHLCGLFHEAYRVPETARAIGAELKAGSYRIFVYGPSLSYFPGNYPELMSYDAIVLDNVPIEAMDEVTLQYLHDYVDAGGALLVIGGNWAFGGGGYKGSALEAFLPVTVTGTFDVKAIKNGIIAPRLDRKQKVGTFYMQDVQPKPGAQVLMTAGGKPFWIQQRQGKGVVAVLTGVCYGESIKRLTAFWEWDGWPQWLSERLKGMAVMP